METPEIQKLLISFWLRPCTLYTTSIKSLDLSLWMLHCGGGGGGGVRNGDNY